MRKEKLSGPGENRQRNVTDFAGSLVTTSKPPCQPQKDPITEHRMPVSQYEQLMTAGGPKMLPTSNV